MGLGDWLSKQRSQWNEMSMLFDLGCETLGNPRSSSPLERADRVKEGRRILAARAAQKSGASGVEWSKVKMSYDRDSGLFQTDNYLGIVGETGQKKKAHIAIDEDGNVAYVRDVDGTVHYSRKDGIGYLAANLDWSK